VTNEELDSYSEEILDRVSANIRKYRIQKRFSQLKLSMEIGMSGSAYFGKAELRKPNHHFNIKHLAKISKVLDVPISRFFEPIE
jgi:transcriptional regulator with XRE-family HTH domain